MDNIKLKLDTELKTLRGVKMLDVDGNKSLTFRGALISICEMHRPKQAGTGESLRAYDLGGRLLNEKDTLSVSKEELDFLISITEQTTIWPAIVIGQLVKYLKVEKTN